MKKSPKKPVSLASLKIEFDREEDGRWIAEIPKLPGVLAYGATKRDAQRRVYAIALAFGKAGHSMSHLVCGPSLV